MRFAALAFALVLAGAGCSLTGIDRVETLTVGPERVECVGAFSQTCYQVQRAADGPWELFYDDIEGFDFEPGFVTVLEVEVTDVADPPADGSSLSYRLVRVVSKTPA